MKIFTFQDTNLWFFFRGNTFSLTTCFFRDWIKQFVLFYFLFYFFFRAALGVKSHRSFQTQIALKKRKYELQHVWSKQTSTLRQRYMGLYTAFRMTTKHDPGQTFNVWVIIVGLASSHPTSVAACSAHKNLNATMCLFHFRILHSHHETKITKHVFM